MTYKERDIFVASLREFADFIEGSGHKLPMSTWDTELRVGVILYDDEKGSALEQMKTAIKVLGKAEKHHGGDYIDVRRKFGNLTLEFSVNREKVCERVVVGTREIEERVIPAYTQDIVEWKCEESLLNA